VRIFLTQLAIKWLFSFSSHPMSASALSRERKPSKMSVEICEKRVKNIPNVIGCNLKHDYQISIIFTHIFNTAAY